MAPIIVVIRQPILLQIADATGPAASIRPVSSERMTDVSAFVALNSYKAVINLSLVL